MASSGFQQRREIRDFYTGSKRRETRDGYGTYVYHNMFFQYAGNWKNGKKHGFGILKMKNGNYYAGNFKNGKIEGYGIFYNAQQGHKHYGYFQNGDMVGRGIVLYRDGSIYEGNWNKNVRHAYEDLQKTESTYYGNFCFNRKHGKGICINKNGDQYEGDWEHKLCHGKGIFRSADGTKFDGLWQEDIFCGLGIVTLKSGLTYSGLWVDDLPAMMATKLVFVSKTAKLCICQNQKFSIRVECRNDKGELVEEIGRKIKISCGFRYRKHITDIDFMGNNYFPGTTTQFTENSIQTPFGYKILPYPLTEVTEEHTTWHHLGNFNNEQDLTKLSIQSSREGVLMSESTEKGQRVTLPEDKELKEKTPELEKFSMKKLNHDELSLPDITSCSAQNKSKQSMNAKFSQSPPAPAIQQIMKGVCEWTNLMLAPVPNIYLNIMELMENAKTAFHKGLGRIHSAMGAKTKYMESKNERERFALPGEYILVAEDITNPPFFGQTLKRAFVKIRVTSLLSHKTISESGIYMNTHFTLWEQSSPK